MEVGPFAVSGAYTGDCRELLKQVPDGVVQTCVTSPPYWGLRDYGAEGQIGLEPTVHDYVAQMVDVFREVRRTLRDDGTCWLNLGDSYAGSWGNQGRKAVRGTQRPINAPMLQSFGPAQQHAIGCDMDDDCSCGATAVAKYPDMKTGTGSLSRTPGLKNKDLVGVPWRVAFALQDDGWYLRQDIIWHKPNPMPESIKDRCTKAHEYVFLLAKSERYFYDHKAIATPAKHAGRHIDYSGEQKNTTVDPRRLRTRPNTADFVVAETTNARSVWSISTEAFSGAHFAVMPSALAKRCVLAGSKPGDLVLDPFFGSGTVGKVAEDLGRLWLGFDLNPEYRQLQQQRISQFGLKI